MFCKLQCCAYNAGIGDLERAISRLCASSLGSFGRDGSSVVLYEDVAKRKLTGFLAALKGLSKLEVRLPKLASRVVNTSGPAYVQ